jgi:hypothetical protein
MKKNKFAPLTNKDMEKIQGGKTAVVYRNWRTISYNEDGTRNQISYDICQDYYFWGTEKGDPYTVPDYQNRTI